jgi:CheY-like chemotaxis protein
VCDDLTQAVEAQMRLLRVRYLEKMADSIRVLETGLVQCQSVSSAAQADFDAAAREVIRCTAHKLSGSGATYGFTGVSICGRRIDAQLKAKPMTAPALLAPMISALIEACTEARASVVPGQPAVAPQPDSRSFGRRAAQITDRPIALAAALPVMLVVDDDEAIRTLFQDMFAGDARILTAIDTRQALKLMRLHQPELVLLDDIMPDCISGLRLLEDIRRSAEFPNTSVIMITASDSDADRERGMDAGAADYITKPFEPQMVARRVRSVLQQMHA